MHQPMIRRTFITLLLVSVPAVEGQPAPDSGIATAWQDVSGVGRVRLIAPAVVSRQSQIAAGVQIVLADGWKTYWRMPGEAGVPPLFDWSGSENTAAIKVRYPAPQRLPDKAAVAVGYKHDVVFPVLVTRKVANTPVQLRLALEFGICRDICIPATASLALTIPLGTGAANPPGAVTAALERVPRPAGQRRPHDPELTGAKAELDGGAPRLTIEARFSPPGKTADAFVEAPDGIYVPLPERLPDNEDGKTRFAVDLARTGNAKELKGKTLTITLVSEAGASEATWTLP